MLIQDGVHHLATFAAKFLFLNMNFLVGARFTTMVAKSFIVSSWLNCWHSVSVIWAIIDLQSSGQDEKIQNPA